MCQLSGDPEAKLKYQSWYKSFNDNVNADMFQCLFDLWKMSFCKFYDTFNKA